jgi:hypothetical protein
MSFTSGSEKCIFDKINPKNQVMANIISNEPKNLLRRRLYSIFFTYLTFLNIFTKSSIIMDRSAMMLMFINSAKAGSLNVGKYFNEGVKNDMVKKSLASPADQRCFKYKIYPMHRAAVRFNIDNPVEIV